MGYKDELKHKFFKERSRKKFQRLILKAAANDNYPTSGGAHIRDVDGRDHRPLPERLPLPRGRSLFAGAAGLGVGRCARPRPAAHRVASPISTTMTRWIRNSCMVSSPRSLDCELDRRGKRRTRRCGALGRDAQRLLADGRHTFRYDTFGDEAFWGDALQLHKASGRAVVKLGDRVVYLGPHGCCWSRVSARTAVGSEPRFCATMRRASTQRGRWALGARRSGRASRPRTTAAHVGGRAHSG